MAMVPKKTAVWWDVDSCPIPHGYDPRCIRPSIESALKKSSGSDDEVTIFALGNLMRITRDDLLALSSSGILMRHTDFGNRLFCNQLFEWQRGNPPPASVMLISNDPHADTLFHTFLKSGFVARVYYNVIPAYQRPDGSNPWTRDTILKESLVLSPSHFSLNDNCPGWTCLNCDFGCKEYQTFAHHLYGAMHDNWLYNNTHFPPKNRQVEIYQEFLKHKALARVPLRQVKNRFLPEGKSPRYG